MMKFKIEGPITIGKGQPIPALPRAIIEDKLGLGLSNESKAERGMK